MFKIKSIALAVCLLFLTGTAQAELRFEAFGVLIEVIPFWEDADADRDYSEYELAKYGEAIQLRKNASKFKSEIGTEWTREHSTSQLAFN